MKAVSHDLNRAYSKLAREVLPEVLIVYAIKYTLSTSIKMVLVMKLKIGLFVLTTLFCTSLSFQSGAKGLEKDWWIADEYIKKSSLQYKWGVDYIMAFPLKGDEHILDIGAGDGRLTALLAKRVPFGSVLGIDKSKSMSTKALETFSGKQFTNLSFQTKGAETIDFQDQFDWVISFNCFHWIKDLDQTFQRIQKALKKGGKLFLFFAPDHGRDRFDHAIKDVMGRQKWKSFFTDFTSDFNLITPLKTLELANKNGLLLEHMKIIKVNEIFKSKNAFADWISGWIPHTKYLPESLRDAFIGEVIERYLERRPGSDQNGKIIYFDYWLEILVEKS